MEEREFERLSRYVDDDLDPTERKGLEDEIRDQPELRSTLDDLLDLKTRVRFLAEQQNPPDTLDDLVRPLRRSGRPPLRQSNLIPFAAIAATVLLAVVLGLEVGRHGRLSDSDNPDHQTSREVFALKALPEADDSSLVGALEHLMALPYPEPDLVEPEALLAIGPLPGPPGQYRERLALAVGQLRMPLSGTDHPVGLVLELSVDHGRITGCQSADEGNDHVHALCSALEGVFFDGVKDGDHRATVVIAR